MQKSLAIDAKRFITVHMKSIRLTLTDEEHRLLEAARASGFTSLAGAARGAALSLIRACDAGAPPSNPSLHNAFRLPRTSSSVITHGTSRRSSLSHS